MSQDNASTERQATDQELELEFNTVSSILKALHVTNRKPLPAGPKTQERKAAKLLTAAIFLMSRDNKIVAAVPKRMNNSLTLFVAEEAKLEALGYGVEKCPPHGLQEVNNPTLFFARNPRQHDKSQSGTNSRLSGTTQLENLQYPEILVDNWNMLRSDGTRNSQDGFELHVQIVAELIRLCYDRKEDNDHDLLGGPSARLLSYVLFMSSAKTLRRFEEKHTIMDYISVIEKAPAAMREGLTIDYDDYNALDRLARYGNREIYQKLQQQFSDSQNQPAALTSFDGSRTIRAVLLEGLVAIKVRLQECSKLRNSRTPPTKAKIIELSTELMILMTALGYLAWHSKFLYKFLNHGLVLSDETAVVDDSDVSKEPEEQFETEQALRTREPALVSLADRVYSWFGLVSVAASYVDYFDSNNTSKGYPIEHMRFEFVRYQTVPRNMKYYKDVVDSLFDRKNKEENEAREAIQTHLSAMIEQNQKDPSFKSLKNQSFQGTVHCEAQLASLWAIANIQSDIDLATLTEQERDLIEELKNAPPMIFSSRRTCPVCRSVMDRLARLASGGSSTKPSKELGALYAHGYIFACSLPPLLPRSVKEDILNEYKGILKEALLRSSGRSPSNSSEMSGALSEHSSDGIALRTRLKSAIENNGGIGMKRRLASV